MSSKYDAVEAQSKAMRDERRKEEEEARGTRFGRETLDTELYEESSRNEYLNYAPGNDDDDVNIVVFLNLKTIETFFRIFKDDDVGFPSTSTAGKKTYGPSTDILQNIPNIDRVRSNHNYIFRNDNVVCCLALEF